MTKKRLKNIVLSRIITILSDTPAINNNKTIITIQDPTITINYKTVVLTITAIIISILAALKIIIIIPVIINQNYLKGILHKRHQFLVLIIII